MTAQPRDPEIKAATCPACNAQPGEPCTQPNDTTRKPVTWLHLARYAAADTIGDNA